MFYYDHFSDSLALTCLGMHLFLTISARMGTLCNLTSVRKNDSMASPPLLRGLSEPLLNIAHGILSQTGSGKICNQYWNELLI